MGDITYENTNVLLRRALVHGISIKPYMFNSVMRQYNLKTIPAEVIEKMPADKLDSYIDGLYLCNQEMAGDWSRGHAILKELGFTERERKEGHRVFISLVYTGEQQ